jgi:hypothetical protein
VSRSDPSPSATGPGRPSAGVEAPRPLLVGAAVVALEGVALAVYGIVQVPAITSDRATMVVTNTIFFLVYGAALVVFGWLLSRLRSWARAPVVLAQLIQLGVAWSFRGGGTGAVSALLTVLAVVVLVAVFHPASLRAVERADAVDDDHVDEAGHPDGDDRPSA